MQKITLTIDGMACGMCETHINDAIRRKFTVKKVMSSHRKGKTEILSDKPLDEEKLKQVIRATGYTVTDIHSELYEKREFLFFRNQE